MRALFGFDGRVSRGTFWIGQALSLALMSIGVVMAALVIGDGRHMPPFTTLTVVIVVVVALLIVAGWINTSVTVQRYHDLGKSGWWSLVACVPMVGLAWLFIECGLLPGEPGANRYGDRGRPFSGGNDDHVPVDYTTIDDRIAALHALNQKAHQRPAASPHGAAANNVRRTSFGRRGGA